MIVIIKKPCSKSVKRHPNAFPHLKITEKAICLSRQCPRGVVHYIRTARRLLVAAGCVHFYALDNKKDISCLRCVLLVGTRIDCLSSREGGFPIANGVYLPPPPHRKIRILKCQQQCWYKNVECIHPSEHRKLGAAFYGLF